MTYFRHTIYALFMAFSATAATAQTTSVLDWSGAYAGLSFGKLYGDSTYCQEGFSDICNGNPSNFDLPLPEPKGGFAAISGGYSWQRNSIVYGVEGDLAIANADGAAPSTADYGCGGNCVTNITNFATIRGRVGYVHNNWMPYVTAGLGALDVEVGFPDFDPTTVASDWIFTPVVGLGVEYMASSNISFKLEALHFFEKNQTIAAANNPCGAPCGPTDVSATIIRYGMNFHF